MTDAELERLEMWSQSFDPAGRKGGHYSDDRCPWCIGAHSTARSLITEVERLRTLVAALTTEDPPCNGPDRAYFGGAVFDEDGVALADQAILLIEPCEHRHG